jgi:hypothetical protein
MTRRSLRPQLNQIRGWVNQGRTDAWIAHQLEVTVQQIESFKRQHGLSANGDSSNSQEELDLRAEDDAAIAEALEEAEREAEKKRAEEARKEEERRKAEAAAAKDDEDGKGAGTKKTRTRSTRRRRSSGTKTFEGTFDHGDEGYGLWLDPAVEDSAIYAEHWAGHRPVEVTIEEDQIIIRRAKDSDEDESAS